MKSVHIVVPSFKVTHTCGNVATLSQVPLVGSENLPTIVVDILDLGVGAFERWNAILVPGSIVAKVFLGQCLCIKTTFEKW